MTTMWGGEGSNIVYPACGGVSVKYLKCLTLAKEISYEKGKCSLLLWQIPVFHTILQSTSIIHTQTIILS